MKDVAFYGLLAVAVGLYAAFGIVCSGYTDLRKQAIERGHAEYVVDSDGKTTWQWKDKDQ